MITSSASGCDIAIHQLGGTGPPLVICHATGFNALTYEPLARTLASTFEVWALDFRGHGKSAAPIDGNFGWEAMATDLLACIDAIGTSSIYAVGHSMGGTAILLAARQRPGCIITTYLYEPIIFPAKHLFGCQESPLADQARRRREVFESREAAFKRYSSKPPLNILRTDVLAAYVKTGFEELGDGTIRLACRTESEALTFETTEKLTIEELDTFTLSLTVGVGLMANSPSPKDFAPLIVDRITGACLIEYEHLGHFGPLQAPDQIAADATKVLQAEL